MTFTDEAADRFLGKYTLLATADVSVVQSVRLNMTSHMGTLLYARSTSRFTYSPPVLEANIMQMLHEELPYVVDTELPKTSDWTSIKLQQPLLRMIAILSGRVFVGSPLNRNEEYLEALMGYTLDCFNGAAKLHEYPKILHPLARYLVPELGNVWRHYNTFHKFLTPVVTARNSGEKKDDLLQWIIENAGEKRYDMRFVTEGQLNLSLAAIHTTTNTLLHAFYDLAAHPEYIEPLREEAQAVMDTEGAMISKANVVRLRKLDSFMKESQRHNPSSIVTMNRKVFKPFTFSDNKTIPAGSYFAMASSCVGMDPEVWDRPEEFDGFRFERMRQERGNENKYQFATTSPDAFYFGHGTHSCPGRFFATNEMKALLCHIITTHDFQLEDRSKGRPPNLTRGLQTPADPSVKLFFRRRATKP
ncbi:hypothetical protein LTS15_004617 [Exophiala xenobiotica]|nr:hypothetical protein LTS15_004617 [Exophiala xenobiotica]